LTNDKTRFTLMSAYLKQYCISRN